MLSPVSPSATGKTLRSLTSCRRSSRCASAAATTARKRVRFVSATPETTRLDSLGYLAGLKAARADVGAGRRALVKDPHLLEVRVEAPLRRDHRVTAAVPERGTLAADVTDLGHGA